MLCSASANASGSASASATAGASANANACALHRTWRSTCYNPNPSYLEKHVPSRLDEYSHAIGESRRRRPHRPHGFGGEVAQAVREEEARHLEKVG